MASGGALLLHGSWWPQHKLPSQEYILWVESSAGPRYRLFRHNTPSVTLRPWSSRRSPTAVASACPGPSPDLRTQTLEWGAGSLCHSESSRCLGRTLRVRTTALRRKGLSLHKCPRTFLVTDIKYESCKILAAEYICLFNCMQNSCQEGFRGASFLRRLPLSPSLWRLDVPSIQAPKLQAI